jgi:anti-sigma factor RsiW
MTTHPAEHTLNEFVDGDLDAAERAAVQRHLDVCAECAALAADLRSVARAAGALEPLAPPAEGWARLEARIRRERTGLQVFRSFVGLAAAAVLIIAAVAGLRVWRTGPVPQQVAGPAEMPAEMLEIEQQYVAAFKDLEPIARGDGPMLAAYDAGSPATIEQSLAVIDRAIVESRAAVAEEPGSEPAQQSLIESLKMKLALLQDTVALINELRKDQPADAPAGASGS